MLAARPLPAAPPRRTLWTMRQVYLAATGMNRGKTTFALGLLAALLARGLSTAFTKPVGQRYALVDDIPADEDAILMRAIFGLTDPLELMSPVHIPRGFTKAFIRGDVVEDLGARIDAAYQRLIVGREAVLIEGTGHAGVGAVVGLSNADVAARLGAPAVIVSEAGVGRPIDEIVLNAALFAQHGVPVAGAVVNKVDVAADPSLPDILRLGLARHGIELLGVLPVPAHPLASHADDAHRADARGAPPPGRRHGPRHRARGHRRDASASRAGAHRPGLAAHPARRPPGHHLGGRRGQPDRSRSCIGTRAAGSGCATARTSVERRAIRRRCRWPASSSRAASGRASATSTPSARPVSSPISCDQETYDVASEVHDLLVKTHPADTAKIEETKRLVTDHFDVDALLERLDRHEESAARRAGGAVVRTPEAGGSRPGRWLRATLRRLASTGPLRGADPGGIRARR